MTLNCSLDPIQASLQSQFPLLTTSEKAILRYLQKMSQKYHQVFPSLDFIAKRCAVCKKTVQRSINKFIAFGWLQKFKRGYQSNVYYLMDCLRNVKLTCKRIFEKMEIPEENVHKDVHVLSSYKDKEYISTSKVQVHREPKLKQHVPEVLQKSVYLTQQQKEKLAVAYGEGIHHQIVKDLLWYRSKGNKIRNMFAFFWSRGKIIASKINGGI